MVAEVAGYAAEEREGWEKKKREHLAKARIWTERMKTSMSLPVSLLIPRGSA